MTVCDYCGSCTHRCTEKTWMGCTMPKPLTLGLLMKEHGEADPASVALVRGDVDTLRCLFPRDCRLGDRDFLEALEALILRHRKRVRLRPR